jgi:hypothetical protein
MGSGAEKIDELFVVFSNASEPCFLKHANRAEIVLKDVSTQRTRRLKAKEQQQSSGGDTSAPELTTGPIAYESVVGCGIGPCANVSGNVFARENGAAYISGIAEDIGGPMGEKTIPTPRWECGEFGGLGIELMNEEDLDILSRNRAQCHAVLHLRT